MDERQGRSAAFAVDGEVGVERQGGVAVVEFGHADEAGVGQRHRRVAVFLDEGSQFGEVVFDSERYGERAVLDDFQKLVLGLLESLKAGRPLPSARAHREYGDR